jgi:hypothetical protein
MDWLKSIVGCVRDNVSEFVNWCKSSVSFGVATIVGVIKTDINSSIKIIGFVFLTGSILFAIVRIYQTSVSSLVQLVNRRTMDKNTLISEIIGALLLIYLSRPVIAGLMNILKSVSNAAIIYLLSDNKNTAKRLDAIKIVLAN